MVGFRCFFVPVFLIESVTHSTMTGGEIHVYHTQEAALVDRVRQAAGDRGARDRLRQGTAHGSAPDGKGGSDRNPCAADADART